jgi:hypothetical protein
MIIKFENKDGEIKLKNSDCLKKNIFQIINAQHMHILITYFQTVRL